MHDRFKYRSVPSFQLHPVPQIPINNNITTDAIIQGYPRGQLCMYGDEMNGGNWAPGYPGFNGAGHAGFLKGTPASYPGDGGGYCSPICKGPPGGRDYSGYPLVIIHLDEVMLDHLIWVIIVHQTTK